MFLLWWFFAILFPAYKQGPGFQKKKKKQLQNKQWDLFYYEGGNESRVAVNKLQTHHSQKFLIYLAHVYTQSYNLKNSLIYSLSWGISSSRWDWDLYVKLNKDMGLRVENQKTKQNNKNKYQSEGGKSVGPQKELNR